jgi:signal transduction histidine kinase
MEQETLTLLLVEDDPGDARLIRELLSEGGADHYHLLYADTLADGLAWLDGGEIDVVLQDLTLSDGHGLDCVRRVRRHAGHVPLVVLTSLNDENLALQAVQEGAQDYLVKGTINGHALGRCIRYAIERERLKSDLAAARDEAVEAARLKAEFLANVSHELRTPLTAILGFSALLRRNPHDTCDARQLLHLERIHENGTHLLAIINDLLDLSKIEAGKVSITMEEIAPATAVTHVVDTLLPLAEERDIDLEVVVHNDLPVLHTDPLRLQQILLNLGGNAIKFTPEGGVTFTVAEGPEGLAFSVRDTGIGIPAEALPTIFDKFRQVDGSTTREHEGTGLGLSVSRSLAHLLGGEIEVESRLGAGSTFTLHLPAAATQTTDEPFAPALHGVAG